MTANDLIEQFVDDMQFDTLKVWAELFGVTYEQPAVDDDWPDWEDELRVKIAEAMMKIGAKA